MSNPQLSDLISQKLGGKSWLRNLTELGNLREFADDTTLQRAFMDVKHQRKVLLADYMAEHCGVKVSPDMLFDVQVKRIHEYKRQFMNILGYIFCFLVFWGGLSGKLHAFLVYFWLFLVSLYPIFVSF